MFISVTSLIILQLNILVNPAAYVGASDFNTRVICPEGTFPCGGNSSLCIEQHKQCDDRRDCPNGEDEAYENCGE